MQDALDTIINVRNQLHGILAEAQAHGSAHQLYADLDRWKQRATTAIADHVSATEARVFARINLRPAWASLDSPDDCIERHLAYFAALEKELARYPAPPRPATARSTTQPAPNPAPEGENSQGHERAHLGHRVNAWLEAEAQKRGKLWLVVGAVITLILTALGVF